MKKESSDTIEAPKYILLQSEFTLSYTEADCFVNDKPIEKNIELKKAPKEACLEKQKHQQDGKTVGARHGHAPGFQSV